MDRLQHSLARCRDRRLAAILDSAGRAAFAAGEVLRRKYDTPLKINHKGRIDLVTEADLASEQAVLKVLQRDHPGIAVLAEESAPVTEKTAISGPLWVIDPLDGTTNFAHAFPWFAVSIGYLEDGECRAGVIYNPVSEEFFCAAAGAGAWLNGRPIRVSRTNSLEQALLATGFPYSVVEKGDEVAKVVEVLRAMLPKAQGIRRAGAAALDLAYVACGRLDGFWEINLKPWDTAAGIALLKEAGGLATDFAGGDFSPFVPQLLASNSLLHQAIRQVINSP
ncbi:inositol monophosphatase family protein [Desulfurivibrio alkaliphilus]|uniref:Inositol-1-monophosphatase n=1 Tax=Desulfurivibrio alkaliphilus (strain DSM 19089 / UNIQEM U267 / AHT2) TaxID=589865 RepID=D6Z5X0_DESAT|nr:inositol monophosphatase family protein [Desulfurivibrio alkaliphilus]ADH84852.1 inositol monophosphatase [Desulfurivibrio alkaliphilus AHT 2]